jgi:hypothetical protein
VAKPPAAIKKTHQKVEKPSLDLLIPRLPITKWVVVGLDLSLSRTGYAVLTINDGEAKWEQVGSYQPKNSKDEAWARATAIGSLIRGLVEDHVPQDRPEGWGLLVSIEFPDPNNSYLMSLNGIVQAVLWSSGGTLPLQEFMETYRLAINASTMHSVLRLNIKGQAADKDVNIALAYNFIDKKEFPNLDSDSCDAVLLAMMGRHAVMALNGKEALVPPGPLNLLCKQDLKVKITEHKTRGIIRKEKAAGLFHNPATWTKIQGAVKVCLSLVDARVSLHRNPTTTLHL